MTSNKYLILNTIRTDWRNIPKPKYVSTEGVTDSESAAAEAIEQPQQKMRLAGTEDNEKMRPAESESEATEQKKMRLADDESAAAEATEQKQNKIDAPNSNLSIFLSSH